VWDKGERGAQCSSRIHVYILLCKCKSSGGDRERVRKMYIHYYTCILCVVVCVTFIEKQKKDTDKNDFIMNEWVEMIIILRAQEGTKNTIFYATKAMCVIYSFTSWWEFGSLEGELNADEVGEWMDKAEGSKMQNTHTEQPQYMGLDRLCRLESTIVLCGERQRERERDCRERGHLVEIDDDSSSHLLGN